MKSITTLIASLMASLEAILNAKIKRWLDSIAFESLSELENAYEADASTLIRIIVDVSDDNFRRL